MAGIAVAMLSGIFAAGSCTSSAREEGERSEAGGDSLTITVKGAMGGNGKTENVKAVLLENVALHLTRHLREPLRATVEVAREPRPTSVDVFLETRLRCVAIERKFIEREFSVCSRPRQRPRDSNYLEQRCDLSHCLQRGRRERCALTEVGIRFWTYQPHLFDRDTGHDQRSGADAGGVSVRGRSSGYLGIR